MIHVHPDAVQIVYVHKGREKLLLISDGMKAVGVGDGTYEFGGQKVMVQKCIARLEDGTLAGSTLTLNRALEEAWHFYHRCSIYGFYCSCNKIGNTRP